ncbi:MAG: SAM hydrolase/SAM-dependent halogenase family protein [Caldisphaera sp.]|nr:SAM-dependent chlorinase/fluorinase [Caldisphaera sp.]PMP61246.1 MAG: hypothetical protein C0201_00155 [Caldisphaera sp.]PMP89471.1 MAG: hypothetical protein C0171_07065 [Caldisphaera sp.]
MKEIGIISDFGYGFYSGIMKGVIKNIAKDIDIIEIDNNVPSFSVISGSYILYTTYRYMPKNSIILSVVDPGVGTNRKAIIVKTRNYEFVSPDNGLIYEAALEDGMLDIYQILLFELRKYLETKYEFFKNNKFSYTFHGRDVFAPTVALLANEENIERFTKRININDIVKLRLRDFSRVGNLIKLNVIYIDKFGNVVLSSKFNDLKLRYGENIIIKVNGLERNALVGKRFADVKKGELILYENSFGFAEIAENQGNASKTLNVNFGQNISFLSL